MPSLPFHSSHSPLDFRFIRWGIELRSVFSFHPDFIFSFFSHFHSHFHFWKEAFIRHQRSLDIESSEARDRMGWECGSVSGIEYLVS